MTSGTSRLALQWTRWLRRSWGARPAPRGPGWKAGSKQGAARNGSAPWRPEREGRGPGADGMPGTRLACTPRPTAAWTWRAGGLMGGTAGATLAGAGLRLARWCGAATRWIGESAGAGELWLDLFQSSLDMGRGLADGRRPGHPGLCPRDRGIRYGPLDVRRRLAPWHGAVQCRRCRISHGCSKNLIDQTANRPAKISVRAGSRPMGTYRGALEAPIVPASVRGLMTLIAISRAASAPRGASCAGSGSTARRGDFAEAPWRSLPPIRRRAVPTTLRA